MHVEILEDVDMLQIHFPPSSFIVLTPKEVKILKQLLDELIEDLPMSTKVRWGFEK